MKKQSVSREKFYYRALRRERGARKYILAGMMAVTLLTLSGCSFAGLESKAPDMPTLPPPPSVTEREEYGVEQHYYALEDTLLPDDAEKKLEPMLQEDEWIDEGWDGRTYWRVANGTVCRALEVKRTLEGEELRKAGLSEENATVSCGRYLQYIDAPYEESVIFRVDGKWDDDERQYDAQLPVITQDGRILVWLQPSDDKKNYVLGEVKRDGTCVILTDAEREAVSIVGDGVVDASSKEYRVILKTYAGGLERPISIYGEDGELYFSDAYSLWRYDDTEPVCILKYRDMDVVFDALYKIFASKEGYTLLTESRGKLRLLQFTETQEPVVKTEKQEVVLAVPWEYANLQELITEFNRKSSEYRVVLQTASEDSFEGYEDYRREIQMQLAAGKGPDVLGLSLNYEGAAKNGYLASVDPIISECADEILPGARDGYMVDGVHYGVPAQAQAFFLAGGQKLLADRERWTTEEMMKAVEQSGAKYLCFNCNSRRLLDGTDIVYYMGLLDDKVATYIDWESGKSHLTEEPFLELMAFAKKYAGNAEELERGEWGIDGHGLGLRDGSVAFDIFYEYSSLMEIQWYEEVYEGKQAFCGYPGGERSGVYLSVEYYFLNASAQCPEGAKEFLRFVLSKEGQEIITTGTYGAHLPVRWDSIEENLERAKHPLRREKKKMENSIHHNDGIDYRQHPMTDEECEVYRKLLKNAEPYESKANGIWSILEEELEPYFNGDRTAEEAARILDNRVQLYLDERK